MIVGKFKPTIIKKSLQNKLIDPNQKIKVRPIIVATDDDGNINPEGLFSWMSSFEPFKDSCKQVDTPEWFTNKNPVDVSIIIPLYKSNIFIRDLIKSWHFSCRYTYEIIFVDDCCPNDSINFAFDSINSRRNEIQNPVGKIIKNLINKGYGQSCNTGAMYAQGKYLIFLNADTTVNSGWIEPIIDLLQVENVGIVGNLQLQKDTSFIDSAGSEWDWDKKLFGHIGKNSYNKKPLQISLRLDNAPNDIMQIGEREMVTGCCFGISAKLFEYVGGFDPAYKIGYWEDTDLNMRIRELGYKVMFTPKSIIRHVGGHSGAGSHVYYNHNVSYFFNKWIKSHRIDNLLLSENDKNPYPPVKNILLRRRQSHGDTLVMTSVLPALKKKYPECKIYCSALYSSETVTSSLDCDGFVPISKLTDTKFDIFYNFDYVNESRPKVNMLTCYAEAVGVDRKDCHFNIQTEKLDLDLPEDFIIVHPGVSDWVGRNWPHFDKISQMLLDAGENVVVIGKYTEKMQIPCTLDLRIKTNISQLAYLMKKAKAFVGVDSFPMHVAQACNLPGVAFFGSVDPSCILHNSKMRAVRDESLPCIGCHNKQKFVARSTLSCLTANQDCVKNITVEKMWIAISNLLKDLKNENNCIMG